MIKSYEIRVHKSECDNCGKVAWKQGNRTLWRDAKRIREDESEYFVYSWNIPEVKLDDYGEFLEEMETYYLDHWIAMDIPNAYGQIYALYCSQECKCEGEQKRKGCGYFQCRDCNRWNEDRSEKIFKDVDNLCYSCFNMRELKRWSEENAKT